jgi:hypothetical protein
LWVIFRLVSVRQSSSRSSLTEGKGTELLARARKVFCLQEKNVDLRRARSEKQV